MDILYPSHSVGGLTDTLMPQVELCALGRIMSQLSNIKPERLLPQPPGTHHIFTPDAQQCNVGYYKIDVSGKFSLEWRTMA
jgi:hypothetical protein